MRIYHNSQDKKFRSPFGAAAVAQEVTLALQVASDEDEKIESVFLRLWQDERGETLVRMQDEDGEGLYKATIRTPQMPGLLWYYFKVATSGGIVYYYGNNNEQLGGEGETRDYEPASFQITVYKYAPVPSWYKDAIVYQIFPDRFARDDDWKERCDKVAEQWSSRLGQRRFIEDDWYRPAYYERDDENNVTGWPFYGGSFKGIEEKLDYIKSLGASVVYLNPITLAVSNHRYDTADYMVPDPMLGSMEDFRSLADAARTKGIRIILDGVFSHTGADSRYFDKYGNFGGEGAFNNPSSEYRSWYEFKDDDPVGYRSWWGIRDLPEVNETEDSFTELICGDGGVLETWLRAGASGYRLDVADELPDSFIKKIRKKIKSESGDLLLLGEVWEDASNKISYGEKRQYLMGEELDSTMNYPITDLLFDFTLGEKSSDETGRRIMSLAENYPSENFYGALNLIGSHDRQRVLTAMGADEDYDKAADKVKLMSVLQYALPGVPCTYYGDEAGMFGGPDPANRDGFIWGRENIGMQNHYRQLGVIYDEHPVLKSADLRILQTGNSDVLAFARTGEDETVIVIANRSDETVSMDKEILKDIDGEYALELLSSSVIKTSENRINQNIVIWPRKAMLISVMKKAPAKPEIIKAAGVICHISSIPGAKLGKPARDFVDYIRSAGMSLWQILPLNPPGLGNSPYSSYGAFAGDERFINDDELPQPEGYENFCTENEFWLEDFAQFAASRRNITKELVKREQYYFDCQWKQLKEYANASGVRIIGDLPVFVSKESSDVIADPAQFMIDDAGHLKCHAGVPPDYFAPQGQDWGNPLYDWEHMKEDGYKWWTRRLAQCFSRYDYVRLDHFRSFSEYYRISEGKTPLEGMWQHGPGIDFFRKVADNLGQDKGLAILAEDLGQLDVGVWNLLKLTGLLGMNVWQFSADEMMNMSPAEQKSRAFYTGTHDNQTLLGWCKERGGNEEDAMDIIRTLYNTDAPWVMMQLQDMLMLDDDARMNVPGIAEGNWQWKVPDKFVTDGRINEMTIASHFAALADITGRTGESGAGKFMKAHRMHVDASAADKLSEEFARAYESMIHKGQIKGVKCADEPVFTDKTVIAIDMGGTNTRVAKVKFTDEGHEVINEIRAITSGRDGKATYKEVFAAIAGMICQADREHDAQSIGFSFSFPQEPSDDGDAVIIAWAKEMQIEGGQGYKAGKLLNEALEDAGYPKLPITVINDTIATLLAGDILSGGRSCQVGFVLGTGANICFMDKKSGRIYNLESGDYDGFPSGDFDEILDAGSAEPGRQLAEKKMSGAYIHQLKEIAADAAKGEREELIDASIIRRDALYAAVTIEGALRLARLTNEQEHVKTAIAVDGSVFWKSPGFPKMVREYMIKINENNKNATFIRVEGAGLLGAAAAAGERR